VRNARTTAQLEPTVKTAHNVVSAKTEPSAITRLVNASASQAGLVSNAKDLVR